MTKVVVLDTNVLLSDPSSIQSFPDSEVIIPMKVLEELDTKKSGHTELARNARQVARTLEAIRDGKDLSEGVILESGSLLRVVPDSPHMWRGLICTPDNIILTTAMKQQDDYNNDVTMVSNDINVRLKASTLGLKTMSHKSVVKTADDSYTGHIEVEVEGSLLEELRNTGKCFVEGEYDANCFVTMTDVEDVNNFAMGRYDSVTGMVKSIDLAKQRSVSGISPRNVEQQMAFDLLLDDSIKLVILNGKAGSGKSLMSIAACLQQIDDQKYPSVLISRDTISLGNEIGWLPGGESEKMEPWMRPVIDSLEVILEGSGKTNKKKKIGGNTEALFDQGIIKVEAISYLRGRTLKNLVCIDECQNINFLTLKTIISRMGDGKLILLGDPSQVDAKGLDSENNGISIAMKLFRNQTIVGMLTLETCERSELAALAAEVMK